VATRVTDSKGNSHGRKTQNRKEKSARKAQGARKEKSAGEKGGCETQIAVPG